VSKNVAVLLRQTDENTGSSFRLKRAKLLLRLHDVFFSVNVACAVAYALSLYVSRSMTPWTPQNDSGYYFLRAAVRISDILHLGIRAPVTTNTVARVDSILFNRTAIALVFVVSICSAAALVFLLVRFCALRFSISRSLLPPRRSGRCLRHAGLLSGSTDAYPNLAHWHGPRDVPVGTGPSRHNGR
jgi:hypothetical protein